MLFGRLKSKASMSASLVLGGLALAPQLASSDPGGWAEGEQARLRLISGQQSVAGAALDLGLEFDLQPGWKIYWRSPGDAGLPPRVDWSGSEKLKQAELAWPVPHRFSLFGLETFGYVGPVVLTDRPEVKRSGKPPALHPPVAYPNAL